MGVDHYENFPVASVLCPPPLRPAVVAVYRFARTADDLADEGTASGEERLAALAEYRADLAAAVAGRPPGPRWSGVFRPLATQIERYALPAALLHRLLDAFVHDATNPLHADRASLLRYCDDSANPIGRLLLHLYGIRDATALRQSDAICSALQLINFWQDVGVDAAKGRFYLPQQELQRAGVALDDVHARRDTPALRALIADLCRWAEALMHEGAPLVFTLPGRAGWELRFVAQGGLRVLEKIRAMDHATLLRRPRLGAADVPLLAWRAVRMR